MSLFHQQFKALRLAVGKAEVDYFLHAPMGDMKIRRVEVPSGMARMCVVTVELEDSVNLKIFALSDHTLLSYPLEIRPKVMKQEVIGLVGGSVTDV